MNKTADKIVYTTKRFWEKLMFRCRSCGGKMEIYSGDFLRMRCFCRSCKRELNFYG